MLLQRWFALAALSCVPLAAAAGQNQPGSNLADPRTSTAALRYESAFKNYRFANDASQSPDTVWRSANEEVEKLGGHAGHIKSAEPDMPGSDKGDPAEPAASPVDHGKHH